MKYLLIILAISFQAFSIDTSFKKFSQSLNYESLENAFLKNPDGIRNQWGVSLGYSYIETALDQGVGGNASSVLVSHLGILNLGVNYALSKKWELLLYAQAQKSNHSRLGEETKLGDTTLAAKYLLLEKESWAFTLMPRIIFNTGEENRQLGIESIGYGFLLNLEKRFNKLGLLLNAGYTRAEDNIYQNINEENLYHIGIGASLDLGRLGLYSEYRVNLNDGSSDDVVNELTLGLNYELTKRFRLFTSLGTTDLDFEGSDQYRYLVGIKSAFGSADFGPEVKNQNNEIVSEQEREEKVIQRVLVGSYYLEIDSYKISQSDIESLVNELKLKEYSSIEIEAHTDSRGSNSLNQVLSEKRAHFVRKVIEDNFKGKYNIETKGMGEYDLKVNPENSSDDYRENRRVDVFAKPE